MPLKLDNPITPHEIDTAKVCAFKVEDNQEKWMQVWVCLGWMEGEAFVESPTRAPILVKIEDGNHPLVPGRSLRKCPSCGAWYGLELVCEACGEATVPYDGFTRNAITDTPYSAPYAVMKYAIYSFLEQEVVPDPVTGEPRTILQIIL